MINGKSVLAIIPARGGSKRLPRKNILSLGGKPLIGWTIEAAKQCNGIDRVIVSTEDKEIAKIAEQFGAEVPFLRPVELAGDTITTLDVVLHLLSELEKNNKYYDYVVLLQPTSPLRIATHIEQAFSNMIYRKGKAIVSVCLVEHPPLWCNTLPDNGSMKSFLHKDTHNVRSQDLPDYYRINGAIYICETKLLRSEKTFLPSHDCYAFIMPQEVSIDIDNRIDFNLAKLLLNEL